MLHDYEPGYAQPFGYLYFIGEKHIVFSRKDLYKDPGFNDCRQALVIPHDMSDAYLVIAYDNERALRIPLAEIYEKGENNAAEYNTEYRPVFVALATKDDALVTVGADSKNNLWKRANKMSLLEQSHLMSMPRRVHDAPIHHNCRKRNPAALRRLHGRQNKRQELRCHNACERNLARLPV